MGRHGAAIAGRLHRFLDQEHRVYRIHRKGVSPKWRAYSPGCKVVRGPRLDFGRCHSQRLAEHGGRSYPRQRQRARPGLMEPHLQRYAEYYDRRGGATHGRPWSGRAGFLLPLRLRRSGNRTGAFQRLPRCARRRGIRPPLPRRGGKSPARPFGRRLFLLRGKRVLRKFDVLSKRRQRAGAFLPLLPKHGDQLVRGPEQAGALAIRSEG